MSEFKPLYDDSGTRIGSALESGAADDTLIFDDGIGPAEKRSIVFNVVKPKKDGKTWHQEQDAANHIKYSMSLGLPQLRRRDRPRFGRAIIVGGAPSIKDHLEEIRALAANSDNAVFALNWSHTWLIQNGIIPKGCVFFEIDVEPDTVLKAAHPDVTYFLCSHCHEKTFDSLKGFKRVLWHSMPNSEFEKVVHKELLDKIADHLVGGGISSFTRTMVVAMFLGYRHFDLFGCDSSFPEDKGTHVDGYETIMDSATDGFYIYAKSKISGKARRFKTLGYLALQVEEFKQLCALNHQFFSLRVHGDSLLRFVHEETYPDQYNPHIYCG